MMNIYDTDTLQWVQVAHESDIPEEEGACIKYGDEQIAIYNFASRGEWYATQNMCPHKQQMILSRGMIGDENGEPKVACPFHKKTYSLKNGKCLNDDQFEIKTYDIKVKDGWIYLLL